MVVPLPETPDGTASEAAPSTLEAQYGPCDAAVIGPGLGPGEETGCLAARFVDGSPLPTVIDAGALVAWGWAGHRPGPGPRVLTPHPGEMAGLTGLGGDAIERDREAIAGRFAADWGSVLVLKGPRTLVAGDGLYLNTAGTPGLGTAGSGDVLAGIIGGLLARVSSPTAAAVWGVHLHAVAGEIADRERGTDGMMASDVVECLPEASSTPDRPPSPAMWATRRRGTTPPRSPSSRSPRRGPRARNRPATPAGANRMT